VATAVATGAVGFTSPRVGTLEIGPSPLALVGLERISDVIRSRRLDHAAETSTEVRVPRNDRVEVVAIILRSDNVRAQSSWRLGPYPADGIKGCASTPVIGVLRQ